MAVPLQVVLAKATGRHMIGGRTCGGFRLKTVPHALPPAGSTRGAADSS